MEVATTVVRRVCSTISPQYIKVDMAIIRDIDTDPDKQQIVVNIVNYAHQRGNVLS